MARRGENIYKRKDNRWEGRYVKGYDSNGKAKLGYVYAKTYHEVREKLRQAKMKEGSTNYPERIVFSKYCEEWLTLSRNRVKEATYAKYYIIVNKYLKPELGKCNLTKINTVTIEHFSNKLLVTYGLSGKTVRDILFVLHSVLDYVYKQQGQAFNHIDIIYPKENKKDMRVLNPEEQGCFIKYLLDKMDTVKFGTLLALLTGMRIGEICALRWQDIDMKAQTIAVKNTLQRLPNTSKDDGTKTRIIMGSVKSDKSRRIIPLTSCLEQLCQIMEPASSQAYVLTGNAFHYMEPRTLQYRIKKYTQACNLNGVHFHTLRHTFATRCVEAGFETKSLSEILGHASVKITLDRYVHSSIELKRANMEKITLLSLEGTESEAIKKSETNF